MLPLLCFKNCSLYSTQAGTLLHSAGMRYCTWHTFILCGHAVLYLTHLDLILYLYYLPLPF